MRRIIGAMRVLLPLLPLLPLLVAALALGAPNLPLGAQTMSLTPFAREKARLILEHQASCLGCHEIEGRGGRVGPSLDYVAQRRNAEYIRAMIADPQSVVPGSAMPKPMMPPASLELITRYIVKLAGPGPPPNPSPRQPASPQPAAGLYARWCASCHGPAGKGDGPNARYLPVRPAVHAGAATMSLRSDDALFDAIAGGGAVMGKNPRMPAFGATLTSAEIRALVGYIRSLCKCDGPPWSRDGARPPL
jgi:mono/diheme cytochrome c family protein